MDFGLSEEQQLVVDTVRQFVETELYPLEDAVERSGECPLELGREIQVKVKKTDSMRRIFQKNSAAAVSII